MAEFTKALAALHDAIMRTGPVGKITVRLDFDSFERVAREVPGATVYRDCYGAFFFDGIKIERDIEKARQVLSHETLGLLSEVG